MSGAATKQELREEILLRRQELDPAWCAEQSAEVQARLMALPVMHAAMRVGFYMAVAGEVDLDDLMESLWAKGGTVCVPALDRERGFYAMACVTKETCFKEARFGLREPESPIWIESGSLDCVLVPGLAFDGHGGRVGHGGGYYDRILCGAQALRIGVAFDFQVFEEVPMEGHDIVMDYLVTPTRAFPSVPLRDAQDCADRVI